MKFSLVQAQLAMESGGRSRIGAERVALLEAIGVHGSISAGARTVGISFRGAWDAVTALNNLFPAPLVIARPGGREGGGAELTDEGRAVVEAFRAAETALRVAMEHTKPAPRSPVLSAEAFDQFLWSVNMRTSARNAIAGTVTHVEPGAVDCEVILRVSDQLEIAAVITERSVRDLDIAVGKRVVALIKSSFVILAREGDIGRTSARNLFKGTIVAREDTTVNSEIILDLGDGKTITAIVTRGSADSLPLEIGDRVCALIKASHVILAVP